MTNDKVGDNHTTFSKYHLFNIFLPFDIVVKIISYLDQDDCLQCMQVSRSWNATIPQYAHNVWSHLLFSPALKYSVHNTKRQVFMGSHVKFVELRYLQDEHLFYETMQTLAEYNCTEIEHLAIMLCHSTKRNYKRLLSLLKQLISQESNQEVQQQLTIMWRYPCMLPFLHILLEACPQVQKLTFIPEGQSMIDDEEEEAELDPTLSLTPIPLYYTSNLTYLEFYTAIDVQPQLIPLIQRSPHLEFLFLGSPRGKTYSDDSLHLLDLMKISTWCPKLVYLEVNPCGLRTEHRDHWLEQLLSKHKNNTNQPKERGIKSFLVSEDIAFGPDQIGPLIQRHANTLEYVGLGVNNEGDQSWAPLFQDLELPRLQTLHCAGTLYDDISIRRLIRKATHLQYLILSGYYSLQLNLAKLLKSCLQLKSLYLSQSNVSFDEDDVEEGQSVTDDSATNSRDLSNSNSLASSQVTHLFQYLDLHGSQLCDISLNYVFEVNDDFMQAIAQLSMLKSLRLFFSYENKYTNEGLVGFIQKLQGTIIETLDIYSIKELTSPMLDAIADLKFLKRFESGMMSHEIQVVNGPALINTIRRSQSLTYINLDHIFLTDMDIHDQDRIIDDDDCNNPIGMCLTRQLDGYTAMSSDFSNYCNVVITKN
ncbi:hypothetical protein BDA99DRAFT_524936 [Phascolomyces articulosus]|uniref:F-box domain-containing protein n=1 Tax=Phascolomyces articulosus TaxID=60185 RepID=A0AAD5JZQ4_9FUNG|nr:hypothetical protein BDA99DRAFT_524936 [Phascolomyces articulosus]